MRQFLFLLLPVLLASSCNVGLGKNGKDGRAGLSRASKASQVIKSVMDNRTTAEWMDARAKVDVKSDKFDVGGTAYIRLHRNEAIWMSVKKFGFEGARILIRPDSFFLVNRLQNDYVAEPLSYIEEKYKVPARFDLLQDIIMGNAVFLTNDLELETVGEEFRLTGRTREFATDYRIDARGFRLLNMEVRDLGEDRTLLVGNNDYQGVDGSSQNFAHRRRVSVNGGKEGTASMDMEFTRVSFDGPVEMPFSKR